MAYDRGHREIERCGEKLVNNNENNEFRHRFTIAVDGEWRGLDNFSG